MLIESLFVVVHNLGCLPDGVVGTQLFLSLFEVAKLIYRIVASTNTSYYSENQLFVQRSQYIRTENPLHKQSEKAKTCH